MKLPGHMANTQIQWPSAIVPGPAGSQLSLVAAWYIQQLKVVHPMTSVCQATGTDAYALMGVPGTTWLGHYKCRIYPSIYLSMHPYIFLCAISDVNHAYASTAWRDTYTRMYIRRYSTYMCERTCINYNVVSCILTVIEEPKAKRIRP